jgi:hypothetical protein
MKTTVKYTNGAGKSSIRTVQFLGRRVCNFSGKSLIVINDETTRKVIPIQGDRCEVVQQHVFETLPAAHIVPLVA